MTPDQLKFVWNIELAGDRNGLPLLWFHGFMGSGTDWQPMIDDLFPEYCNILVDLPGHGKSNHSSKGSYLNYLNYLNYLDVLMDQLSNQGFGTFVAIGYSLGGRVALHFQQRFPRRILGLVGLSTAPGLKTAHERLQRHHSDELLMDSLERLGFSDFLTKWYAQPIFGSIQDNNELFEKLLESRSKNEPEQLRTALNLFGNGALPSLWNSLTEITTPILLLSGSQDAKYCGINQEMVNLLPTGRHRIVAGGHSFHLEKPLETALAIRHFLSELIEGV
ncbi:MAG: 2-succinyl-6-hydroxy-2,4-cyclohexadiene-1-carboxylate synthase [Candidatus Marinimicrobia bacterium]|nr:2-succinyl-6-hydroxy-2,4-cyclohexadiene-1-carboxylate synthase [Candidatus Neomarinimicrobiota bacterium]